MKPRRNPVSHHHLLLKPPPSISFSQPLTHRKSPLHTLLSYFLTLDSAPAQAPPESPIISSSTLNPRDSKSINTYLPLSSLSDLTPSSGSQKYDLGSAQLLNPSKQPKPTKKSNFISEFLSPNHRNNESINAYFLGLFYKSKPITKTLSCDPMLPKFFTQTRLFSAGPSDPYNPVSVVSALNSSLESSQHIDAGSSIRKPLSLWPGMYHSPVTNALWEARSSLFERPSNAPADDAVPDSELITRTPSESRTSILYKFSDDYMLREQYRNPWNEIRMGKLLEDLDALAGTISYKHCFNSEGTTRPLLLVTASVDKIVLKKPIHIDTDLKISGAVTWVGRSSMEIQLEVTQSATGETSGLSDSVALVANFTFVARDSETGKSAFVNKLSPETEREKVLWKEAEERNQMRKQKRGQHRKEIEDSEVDRLKELLAEGRIFCDMPALADRDSILIRDTCLQNSLMCQPQQRNLHGRIFGGFLMRRAFELAFATAYAFAGSAPCFLEVDHVDFLKPVDVGNFLRLKSCVLYTELENPDLPLINVEVVAHVMRPEFRSSEVSNKFYFTFTIRSEAMQNGLRIRNVVPATEEEARRVIERMDAESL